MLEYKFIVRLEALFLFVVSLFLSVGPLIWRLSWRLERQKSAIFFPGGLILQEFSSLAIQELGSRAPGYKNEREKQLFHYFPGKKT
jgi:hypothetical protein